MAELFIKPSQGLVVRDPETHQPLSIEGEKKPRSGYWLKRLRDGDVVEITTKSQKRREEK